MDVDRFAYVCWRDYLAVSQTLTLDWAAILHALEVILTIQVQKYKHIFVKKNIPTKPYAMHEGVGMDCY